MKNQAIKEILEIDNYFDRRENRRKLISDLAHVFAGISLLCFAIIEVIKLFV